MASMRPQLPGQQVDGPDAAAGDAAVAGGQLIMDVGGRQHGTSEGWWSWRMRRGDAALAGGQNLVYKVVHSKRLLA